MIYIYMQMEEKLRLSTHNLVHEIHNFPGDIEVDPF